jgi:hypothetical protein
VRQFDAVLASLKNQGLSRVGSVEELLDWLFREETHLRWYADGDLERIASELGLDERVVRTIMRSHSFLNAAYSRQLFHHFSLGRLAEVYEGIAQQLSDPDVPLGAKRSMLEFLMRQMGLEKPRKLSVKQQSEIVVRVEPVKPVEVLEVLGVPVEQNALPASVQAPTMEDVVPGDYAELLAEADRDANPR